jgi:hypothetical protein
MSTGIPTALALAGTALMAAAIFGPFRHTAMDAVGERSPVVAAHDEAVHWPALVQPSAAACDVPARIELADALGALQSPWAATILHQALETERDPAVREAIAAALSSSQSLVT